MADQQGKDLAVPSTDAGTAFRLEMWASNMLLGYWWVLAVGIAAILAGVAIYGFWQSTHVQGQQTTHAEAAAVLARVEARLVDGDRVQDFARQRNLQVAITPSFEDLDPAFPPRLSIPLETALAEFGAEDAEREAVLTEAGDELLAIAGRGSGTAAGHTALLAAELYRLAGANDGRDKALAQARGSSVATIRYAADATLAAEAGNVDEAASILRPWIAEENGFHGQQAALALGGLYEAADRDGDAQAVYQELKATWPASPLLDQVDERLEGLGVATGTPNLQVPADAAVPVEPAGEAPGGEGTAPSEPAPAGEGAE